MVRIFDSREVMNDTTYLDHVSFKLSLHVEQFGDSLATGLADNFFGVLGFLEQISGREWHL